MHRATYFSSSSGNPLFVLSLCDFSASSQPFPTPVTAISMFTVAAEAKCCIRKFPSIQNCSDIIYHHNSIAGTARFTSTAAFIFHTVSIIFVGLHVGFCLFRYPEDLLWATTCNVHMDCLRGIQRKVSTKTPNLASYGVHTSYNLCLDVFQED